MNYTVSVGIYYVQSTVSNCPPFVTLLMFMLSFDWLLCLLQKIHPNIPCASVYTYVYTGPLSERKKWWMKVEL